jgi:CRISPR-associated protein Cmr1
MNEVRVELTLNLDTIFIPGSADPFTVDPDWPLRPSELKGIWRWWARAFVAGVLFDKGYLCGRQDQQGRISRDEINLISRIVGEGLGLGHAAGKGRISEFRIFIEPLDIIKIKNLHQRIITAKIEK